MIPHLDGCIGLVCSHFSLPVEEFSSSHSFEELETALTKIINNLLDQDMNRLINACYKIDLGEQVFNDIISREEPSAIASTLAKTIIARELLKVKTRAAYKNK